MSLERSVLTANSASQSSSRPRQTSTLGLLVKGGIGRRAKNSRAEGARRSQAKLTTLTALASLAPFYSSRRPSPSQHNPVANNRRTPCSCAGIGKLRSSDRVPFCPSRDWRDFPSRGGGTGSLWRRIGLRLYCGRLNGRQRKLLDRKPHDIFYRVLGVWSLGQPPLYTRTSERRGWGSG